MSLNVHSELNSSPPWDWVPDLDPPQSAHRTLSSTCSEDTPILLRRGGSPGEYFPENAFWVAGKEAGFSGHERNDRASSCCGELGQVVGPRRQGLVREEPAREGLWRGGLSSLGRSSFPARPLVEQVQARLERRAACPAAHSSGALLWLPTAQQPSPPPS